MLLLRSGEECRNFHSPFLGVFAVALSWKDGISRTITPTLQASGLRRRNRYRYVTPPASALSTSINGISTSPISTPQILFNIGFTDPCDDDPTTVSITRAPTRTSYSEPFNGRTITGDRE